MKTRTISAASIPVDMERQPKAFWPKKAMLVHLYDYIGALKSGCRYEEAINSAEIVIEAGRKLVSKHTDNMAVVWHSVAHGQLGDGSLLHNVQVSARGSSRDGQMSDRRNEE